MATAGLTSPGASAQAMGGEPWFARVTPSTSGVLASITVYLLHGFGGGDSANVALYADDGAGRPGQPLAISITDQAIATGPANYTFSTFHEVTPGGKNIVASTIYWLAVWPKAAGVISVYYNGSAPTGTMHLNTNNERWYNWPRPFSYGSDFTNQFTIYMTYTEVTMEQEGFRFRNDDGNETTATWYVAQDTNATKALAANLRLRLLANATGDPPNTLYKLYFKKSTETYYKIAQIGATVTIPTFVNKGTFANGTGVIEVQPPASLQMNDFLVLVLNSANQAFTAMDGWTEMTNSPQSTGTAGAAGGVSAGVYYKWTDGNEIFVHIVDPGSYVTGQMYAFRGVDRNIGVHVSAGSVDSSATTSLSCPSVTTTIDNCLIVNVIGLDKDLADSDTISSVTNASLGSVTEQHDQTVTAGAGGGIALITGTKAVAGGSGNTTATGDTSTTHAYVTFALPPNRRPIYIATSSNITASGDATTAQLNAPSGKSTSDFVTGRMWDDENGTDSINITTDDYTELEWCLQAQSPAANGDIYEFQVWKADSPLHTYTLLPTWAIGTPAGSPITANLLLSMRFNGSPYGKGLISARATSTIRQTAAMSAKGFSSANARFLMESVANLIGRGRLTANVNIAIRELASLTALGRMSGNLDILTSLISNLTAIGRMSGNASMKLSETIQIYGPGALVAKGSLAFSVISDIKGLGRGTVLDFINFSAQGAITGKGIMRSEIMSVTSIKAELYGKAFMLGNLEIHTSLKGEVYGRGMISSNAQITVKAVGYGTARGYMVAVTSISSRFQVLLVVYYGVLERWDEPSQQWVRAPLDVAPDGTWIPAELGVFHNGEWRIVDTLG